MSKELVEKIVHEKCGKKTLQVWKKGSTYDGFCFSCHTYVKNPYSNFEEGYSPPAPKVRSPEEIQAELDSVQEYQTLDLPDRKLSKRVLQYFGVKTAVSEENGQDVVAVYYPYTKRSKLSSYKVRIIEGKKFFSIGDATNLAPFGWEQAKRSGARKLFITEGENDALALFRVLKTYSTMKDRHPAVISLCGGTTSVEKLAPFVQEIRDKFAEVVFVPDQDEAGKIAEDKMHKLLPEVKIAKLPLKDANDMLMQGRDKECFNICMFEAKARLPGQMLFSSDLWELARVRPAMGLSWPWPSLTKMTRGIRGGETIYLGAGVKLGKSVVVNELATHFIKEHKQKVFLCKPEEAPAITARKLAGTAIDCIFDDPNIKFDEQAFAEGSAIIGSNAIIYDSYQKTEWEDVKSAMRHAAVAHGCTAAFIDPITCFTVGMSGGERNDRLVEIATEAAAIAKELDITVFIFCHLNPPQAGPSHERGGAVQSVQFAGSRAMMRSCHAMIGLEGNKDPDLPVDERNRRDIVLLEDRNFGESGRVPLFYNKDTGRLKEMPKEVGVGEKES